MDEKRLISLNWIVGYLAMWAVRNAPKGWPGGLMELVEKLTTRWDREASEWLTLDELTAKVGAAIHTNSYAMGWGRPAQPIAYEFV